VKNFDYLKKISGGIKRGEMHVIMAEENVGKTMFGDLDLAWHKESMVVVVAPNGVARLNCRGRYLDELPVIPKLPPESPDDRPGNKAVARCGECGRVVYQIEWYSCQNSRCPVQRRPSF
jgi:hypothetical protein